MKRPARIRSATLSSVLGLGLVLLAVEARTVSPKYWIHDAANEFLEGETKGVSVMSEGTLRLAPKVDTLVELDEPYIWDLAVDTERGDTYLGTGDEGQVFRVRGEESEPFFQCAALEVLSVAVDGEGRVYAGTAPEGFVYRIERDGTGEILFDADENYVWDLTFGPDGKLYGAFGPNGVVYRIDPASGSGERFFAIDDNHVVCLAFDGDGNLLLGTEGEGLVIRVNPEGEAHALYDCPQGEVRAVIAGPNGEVWAAAASSADVREAATIPDGNGDGTGLKEPQEFSFSVTPPGADDAVLYRIDSEGNAMRHWESGEAAIFDLEWSPDGDLLATTGEMGSVYAVDEAGRATLVLEAEEDQVVTIQPDPRGDAFLLATANPSRVLRMSVSPRRRGTYESDVLDAGRLSRWGRIEWIGEEEGGKVSFAIRSGNTKEPDATWSDWKENVQVKPRESSEVSTLAKSRFLQWRATLEGSRGSSPLVRRVRISSLENNVPPVVQDVRVVPAGNRFYDDVPELRPRPLYQALPGGAKVQYSYDHGGDEEFPPEQRAPWTQGLRQVQWNAIDPNGDFLVFDLYFRRVDEERWKKFAEDIEGQNFTFNASGVPDGAYRIRVTASDRRFNPQNEKTSSESSEIFLVDNTAPDFRDLKHRRDGEDVRITGLLSDELSDLVRLEYSVNGDDWVDRAPADGIFDSGSEGIDVRVKAPEGEEHSVMLRGTDLAGNLGSTRILIRP